jgi:Zn-finger nucleic acid-binding protein
MICPICKNDLIEMTVGTVTIDACDGGCGGVWLDNFELNKILADANAAHQVAARVKPKPEGFFDYTQRHTCPRCTDVVLHRHFFSPKKQVEIDLCPNCNGRWLDAHELQRIEREIRERNGAAK